MAYNNDKKDKLMQNKKNTRFCETTDDVAKKHKIFNKNGYAFFQRCAMSLPCFPLTGFVNNVIIRQGSKKDSEKTQLWSQKKLKTGNTRKEKPLGEYKTVIEVDLLLRGSWVPIFFYWDCERSWEKYDKIVAKLKSSPIFSQNKYIPSHNRH